MVTPRYFPLMGGIETHVHEVGRRLAQAGIKLTLLTTRPPGLAFPLPRETDVEGMHIIRVKAWPSQRDYYIAPEIYRLVKLGQWDLIHCQGCHTFVPPVAMLAARNAHIPYLLTFHTGGHASHLRNRMRATQWKLLRPLLANAAALIGVSHFEANYFRDLLHLPAKQFTVIPNGINLPTSLEQFPPPHPQELLIISAGRLEAYKGHQHLITAMPEILKWQPDAQLLILGSGPYEATLRALAHQLGIARQVDIRAIPPDARQEMVRTLACAALVTLFSEYEAHPLVVLEALALRRPVLVAATSGLQELAEQGLVRALPLHSSPAEIAQAVRQQIEAPLLPSSQVVLSTWDECANRLQEIYARHAGCSRNSTHRSSEV